MSKQNLFVPKVKNHVSRNAFDVSQRRIYSAKAGEILPCMVRDCLPGDKIKINASSFTRTAPLNTAAFARIKQYFNFYFVPYRLLYRDFPSFVIQQSKSSKAANSITGDFTVPSTLPHTTEHELCKITNSWFSPNKVHAHQSYANIFGASDDKDKWPKGLSSMLLNPLGFNRMTQTRKLLQYLGYYKLTKPLVGDSSNIYFKVNNSPLSLFPLLAYQKVYNDYYRFSQWENESARTYNIDYMSGSTDMVIPISKLFDNSLGDGFWYPKTADLHDGSSMFDMRYVNYTKDSFLGVVPSSQFGAVSTVDAPLKDSILNDYNQNRMYLKSEASSTANKPATWSSDTASNKDNLLGIASAGRTSVKLVDNNGRDFLSDRLQAQFDILTLRSAQAKQKFMEVTLSNNSDYKSQIEAHFNVKVSSLMSNLCDYIGGFSSDLSLDTVTNQNLADGNSADYSALATMSGNGHVEFEVREHGLIIGVSYILPFIDYSAQGYDFPCLRVNFDDFALPEFDRLGFEEVDPRLLTGYQLQPTNPTGNYTKQIHLGYGPRYYDYKTNVDIVLGDFNEYQDGTQPIFTVNLTNNAVNLPIDTFTSPSWANYLFSLGLISDALHNNVSAWSFKVNPSVLNNIFTVSCGIVNYPNTSTDTNNPLGNTQFVVHDDTSFDQFYNVLNLSVTVISNLDRLGLPY